MKRKAGRPSAKASSRASTARSRPRTSSDTSEAQVRTVLQYKVVELSTVDEASLEDVVNTYSREGWAFDGVQFAMREASKRPAMAFVFMTRSVPADGPEISPSPHGQARERLVRLAAPADVEEVDVPTTPHVRASSPYERLRQLAEMSADDDGDAEDDR